MSPILPRAQCEILPSARRVLWMVVGLLWCRPGFAARPDEAAGRAPEPPLRKRGAGEKSDGADKGAEAGGAAGAKTPAAGPMEALALRAALARVLERRQAAVIVYDGGPGPAAAADGLASRWRELLADRAARKVLERLVLASLSDAELDDEYPGAPPLESPPTSRPEKAEAPAKERAPAPDKKRDGGAQGKTPAGPGAPADELNANAGDTVARRLGLTAGRPAIVLLDFRERLVRRHVGRLPERSELLAELRALVERNRQAVERARGVEAVLEASRYAHGLGDSRTAVMKLLPLLEPKTIGALDALLRAAAAELESRYRGEARRLLGQVRRSDADRKYAAALEVLERITKGYPFPDVLRDAARLRGEVVFKMQHGL